MLRRLLLAIVVSAVCTLPAGAIEKPGVVYKVFQFPADKIPRIEAQRQRSYEKKSGRFRGVWLESSWEFH